MKHPDRLAGWPGWVAHRLFANYWLLAVCAVIAAVPFALGVLWLDREGATAILIARDLIPVADPETARDFLGVAAGINAAFITLYFSITLIVLSMAAGNLGVRLIDRWLQRRLSRVSIAGLSFTLIVTFIAMLAVKPTAPMSDVPLLLLIAVFMLQAVNVAMLAVSLHALGRTMFIDTSVHAISQSACSRSVELTGVAQTDIADPAVLSCSQGGYVESVDIAGLRKVFGNNALVKVLVAPGQHVLKGEAILLANCEFDKAAVERLIGIGSYRSDAQGAVFEIRLLVEIAARALSPAINDFYTAIACADKLAAVIESQKRTWIGEGQDPAVAGATWLRVMGQDFQSLFEDPLNALRQAACQYPSVAIRLIDNYGGLASSMRKNDLPAEMIEFLDRLAVQLRDHTMSVAEFDYDKDCVADAYHRNFAHLG